MRNAAKPLSSAKTVQWLVSHRQLLLVMMLALLHANLMRLVPVPYGRIPLLLHFALFLLWQPFVSARSRVGAPTLVWIGVGILIAAFGAAWYLLALWLVLLAGTVGGQVFFFGQGRTRWFYLLALAYLIVMLLFQVVPQVIPEQIEDKKLMSSLAGYGAPVLLVLMALLPESREQGGQREAIDLVYSLFVVLVLSVLVLGSTSLMLVQQTGYPRALLTVVFAVAATLLAASWLWNPAEGVSRLGAIASRYTLSIGLPFEQWLRALTDLAEQEESPERFLDQACASLARQLPWVSACTWASGAVAADGDGRAATTGVTTVFHQGDISLVLTTQQALTPVVAWHLNLVTQLVARFYVEKQSRRQLRELVYMQAIHETGARLTHDVKNLLQSLHALLFVIEDNGNAANPRVQPLLRRQLPLIAQRLQQTLDKLRAPDDAEERDEMLAAEAWWRELAVRYEGRGIGFESRGDAACRVPGTLFTSAAENLLQNALDKRALEPGIDIKITLDTRARLPVLSVRDGGSALREDMARDIGQRPVNSENGLGIGLYQLARLAHRGGYALELDSNRSGEVVFSLRPAAR